MSHWALGLRTKAIVVMILASLVAIVPTTLIGMSVVASVQEFFGNAYARNLTELSRQQIQSPLERDLALSQRLAASQLLSDWLLDEQNTEKRERFFREADGFAETMRGSAYFAISANSLNYYFNDADTPDDYSQAPRYQLSRDSTDDAWFFNIINTLTTYNINVNPDVQLGTTRVWLNLPVRHNGATIGLAGTGLDLTDFLNEFIQSDEPGVTPMILDRQGFVQAHPDPDQIAYGSAAGLRESAQAFAENFDVGDRNRFETALGAAEQSGAVQLLDATINNRNQLLAVAYMPELEWHLVTAVDLSVAQIMSRNWWLSILVAFGVMLVLLLVSIGFAVERLVIRPLGRLRASATAISQGNYQVDLPVSGRDEIGELGQAFDTMAQQVRNHTEELERRVRERTQALEESNREIAQFNKMVNDSIDYASLIQQAILPSSRLHEVLGTQHFVLWKPRDVVGGDFYFFQNEGSQCVVGLVDCAGHGVPGALMTMLSRAAFDQAVRETGLNSPAAILDRTDAILRSMLEDLDLPRALATNMDAGLVSFQTDGKYILFAGAKISLFVDQGNEITEIRGQRRALVGRKRIAYEDQSVDLEPDASCYMTSDGMLDQAGGELGYGMGSSGFIKLLQEARSVSIARRGETVWRGLQSYQGDHDQRDDICVIGLKLKAG